MQLLEALLGMISDGVIVTDLEGRIRHVNKTFTEWSGYRAQELIGKPTRFLKSAHHDEKFYHELWGSLLSRREWHGAIWNRKKNGEIYAMWLWIRTLTDVQNEPTGYVGVYSDIPHKQMDIQAAGFLASHYDILTGLPNRLFFNEKLNIVLALAKRHVTRFAVLYLNLDGLNSINTLLGYHVGDVVLQQVAKRLQNRVREVDIVARMGRDEFAVIVTEIRRMEDIVRIGRTIHKWLQTPYALKENTVTVSASSGIAIYPDDSQDGKELINDAHAAMLQAKATGPGRFCFYNQTQISHDI